MMESSESKADPRTVTFLAGRVSHAFNQCYEADAMASIATSWVCTSRKFDFRHATDHGPIFVATLAEPGGILRCRALSIFRFIRCRCVKLLLGAAVRQ